MPDPISWIIIILCIVGHFFFSSAETALACCNRFKLQVEAEEGKRTSKLVVKVCESYDRALTTVLIGNNIVAIALSTVSALLFYKYFVGTGLENYSSLISSIIMTLIVYILGDTLPKTIARTIPDQMSKVLIYPTYGLMIIFYPIAKLFEFLVNAIEKIFKVKTDDEFTQEDFENVVANSEKVGDIEEEQADIIQSSLEFSEMHVKEVFTPKEKMFAINVTGLTREKLHQIVNETSYSRIPLYKDDFNNIIGILIVKKYVSLYLKDSNIQLRKVIQKPYFVSSRVSLMTLFNGFKKHKTHIAIVGNDDQVIGMVTMEDILEEIVSDIAEPNLVRRKGQ